MAMGRKLGFEAFIDVILKPPHFFYKMEPAEVRQEIINRFGDYFDDRKNDYSRP